MQPLWQPSADRVGASELVAFWRLAAERYGADLGSYAALHAWSCREPEQFWPLLWEFLGIIGERGERVLEAGASMADTQFFPDARLSFAENLVRRRDDRMAIIAHAADGSRHTLTSTELADAVARVAAELRALGVVAGDRVVGVLPNIPEAIVAMLAANSIGAIWSLCDRDLGITAIVDRFGQIGPVVMFVSTASNASELCERLPSVRHVIVASPGFPDLGSRDVLRFDRQAFNAPAFVLYTSGTTGLPKCIVHNTGGMLLQLSKENRIHYDVRANDRYFYQTSTGWNMWYWVAIALAADATIVIREGSPVRPRPTSLFDLADAEQLTHLGVSPAYLAQIRAAGVRACETHSLETLRTVLSTGSPLSPSLFDYVYQEIKRDVALISLSGGTEINACFVTGNPSSPIYRGEIQAPALGMSTAVFDDAGRAIERTKGELVCTAAFPSQPVGFWADPDRRRYLATYFERYPGAWHHGDFAETTEHGGFVIHGRSDSVLKPGGHRIGTSEIYRQLESMEEIEDCVAAAQAWNEDVRIILFVQLRAGRQLAGTIEKAIRTAILRGASALHVPARIIAVPAIPYTKTGKKAEVAVRQAMHGETVANIGSLANPESLDHFRDLVALLR
ncbi:MAG: acetoacetate--CoA ligase [Kofleriaceae bacterium]